MMGGGRRGSNPPPTFMDISIVPAETLDKIREYFKTSPDEMGCLVTKDWQVIPFENCADERSRRALIKQLKDEDVLHMLKLIEQDNLFAWVHSHPTFPAYPSGTDIYNHDVPCNMMIWSGTTDTFGIWSPDEIMEMRGKAQSLFESFEGLKDRAAYVLGQYRHGRCRGILEEVQASDDPYMPDDWDERDPRGGEGWVCYNSNDPSIVFTLGAMSRIGALHEALDRLGWSLAVEPVTQAVQ